MMDIRDRLDLARAKSELEGDRITVGLAICGVSSGGMPVFEALRKARLGVPVVRVGCIGMCYNEPLVTVTLNGKKSIYGKVTKENVKKLIGCIRNRKECKGLLVCHDIDELEFYRKQKRLVMENCGIIEPLNLGHYVTRGGYSGLARALGLKPADVVDEIRKSGLRGRGGAGFPTWMKWDMLVKKSGK